jgi:hypothetical protein
MPLTHLLLLAASNPLAAASPAPPQEAELLPGPADWRLERIDFPLPFAPGIGLEGFEELRFAPGMFDPGSDTYWSYALALRLEGRPAVDAAFLETFLVDYYRGLCEAVSAGKGLELPPDTVRASVALGGHGFVATVDLVDAFVTGEPLRLELDLAIDRGGDTTEVLGLASPMPRGGPAWEALRAVGADWLAARPPAAYLNHLYLVPDEVTYRALEESGFLREDLGVFEERTTVRTDLSYTGLYLYGRHTYFELLRPDARSGLAPGRTGLALGFETPDGTARVAARLEEHGIASTRQAVTRGLEGEQLPWFEMLGIASPDVSLFSLEYVPEFLERWHGDLAPRGTSIARDAVLQRYAALLSGDDAPPALLEDVVEVHLALAGEARTGFLTTCEVLGLATREVAGRVECDGPGYRLVVREGAGGITGFVARLSRAVEPRTLALGSLRIELADRLARFSVAVR